MKRRPWTLTHLVNAPSMIGSRVRTKIFQLSSRRSATACLVLRLPAFCDGHSMRFLWSEVFALDHLAHIDLGDIGSEVASEIDDVCVGEVLV